MAVPEEVVDPQQDQQVFGAVGRHLLRDLPHLQAVGAAPLGVVVGVEVGVGVGLVAVADLGGLEGVEVVAGADEVEGDAVVLAGA